MGLFPLSPESLLNKEPHETQLNGIQLSTVYLPVQLVPHLEQGVELDQEHLH